MYKVLNGMVPGCIADLVTKRSSCRGSLRSNDLPLLAVPRTKLKNFGDRAFAYAGSLTWNKVVIIIYF